MSKKLKYTYAYCIRKAYKYKIDESRYDTQFKKNNIIKCYNKQLLKDDESLYTIVFNKKKYVLKPYDKNEDDDEYKLICRLFRNDLYCPYTITYHCCMRSLKSGYDYIMMDKADMDLFDYITKYHVEPNYELITKLIKMYLEFQMWCIQYLRKVYMDIKTPNVLVNMKNTEYRKDVQFLMSDMALMYNYNNIYQLEHDQIYVDYRQNYMFPRKRCRYEKAGLYTCGIFIFELLTFHSYIINGKIRFTKKFVHNKRVVDYLDGRRDDDRLWYLYDQIKDSKNKKYKFIMKFMKKLLKYEFKNMTLAYNYLINNINNDD